MDSPLPPLPPSPVPNNEDDYDNLEKASEAPLPIHSFKQSPATADNPANGSANSDSIEHEHEQLRDPMIQGTFNNIPQASKDPRSIEQTYQNVHSRWQRVESYSSQEQPATSGNHHHTVDSRPGNKQNYDRQPIDDTRGSAAVDCSNENTPKRRESSAKDSC